MLITKDSEKHEAAPAFSYSALLRESLRVFGVLGTFTHMAKGAFEVVRDSLPARKRLRYGDIDFDFDTRMDTTWSNIGFITRVREVFAGRGYQPTDPQIFREMMEQVSEDMSRFAFIDVGSGKGRALLLAREYPFAKIIGVELLPELHHVARQNVARLTADEQSRFELICSDARDFPFPLEPTFLYLFDPLPAEILAEVVARLEQSIREVPREVIIGYQNPVSERVLANSKMFEKCGGTMQWALYRAKHRSVSAD